MSYKLLLGVLVGVVLWALTRVTFPADQPAALPTLPADTAADGSETATAYMRRRWLPSSYDESAAHAAWQERLARKRAGMMNLSADETERLVSEVLQ